jgi:hypothetical protein
LELLNLEEVEGAVSADTIVFVNVQRPYRMLLLNFLSGRVTNHRLLSLDVPLQPRAKCGAL